MRDHYRDKIAEQQAPHGEFKAVLPGDLERRVFEHEREIAQPGPGRLAAQPHVLKAHLHRLEDGQPGEQGEHHERGQQEQIGGNLAG